MKKPKLPTRPKRIYKSNDVSALMDALSHADRLVDMLFNGAEKTDADDALYEEYLKDRGIDPHPAVAEALAASKARRNA